MTDVRTQDSPTMTQDNSAASNKTGGYIWYELMTPDAEAAKDFYDAVVGWNIGPAVAEYHGYRMINRSDGGFAGGVLPLTPEMQEKGARPTWLGYIHVDDVDQTVAKIEQQGGRTWMSAMDLPNVGRVALVTDPQAAPFYIMKPVPPASGPDMQSDVFSPNAGQRVGWNELQTDDVEAVRGFYGEHFGWNSDDAMDMGEHGQYRFFDHNGQRIGAVFKAGNDQPPHWRYYFRVPSIAAAKRTAEEKGGTVHMGPHQVPGGDWIIIGSDPQGAEFALVGAE